MAALALPEAEGGIAVGIISPMPDGIIRKPVMSMPPISMSAESQNK